MKGRAVHINPKIVKGKRVFYFLVLDANWKLQKTYHPPIFNRTFDTRKQAIAYAMETIAKLNSRFKNVRYLTRYLYDND